MPALPIPALTPDQMSRVDRIMVDEFGVEVLQLMEVAGQAVAAWARERFLGGDARGKTVLVLAGSGGNGGDGMVAARFLQCWGAHPMVWLSHEAATLRGAAAHQLRSLLTLGLPIHPPPKPGQEELGDLPDADLVVDASRFWSLRPTLGSCRASHRRGQCPSRADPRRRSPVWSRRPHGGPYEPCIRADATLTLALPKTGLLASATCPVIGELAVADIGIPAEVYDRIGIHVSPLFAERSIVRVEGHKVIR